MILALAVSVAKDLFPFQEFLPSPNISLKCGWCWLLLNWLLSVGVQRRAGVQGKGEAGANSEGELESQTLQRSRHLEAREDSLSPTAVILVYF